MDGCKWRVMGESLTELLVVTNIIIWKSGQFAEMFHFEV